MLKGGDKSDIKAAGVPNITGETTKIWTQWGGSSGALVQIQQKGSTMSGGSANNSMLHLGFDASRSNPIYGRSNKVQPPAIAEILQTKF